MNTPTTIEWTQKMPGTSSALVFEAHNQKVTAVQADHKLFAQFMRHVGKFGKRFCMLCGSSLITASAQTSVNEYIASINIYFQR